MTTSSANIIKEKITKNEQKNAQPKTLILYV